jgi:hypothetical protein
MIELIFETPFFDLKKIISELSNQGITARHRVIETGLSFPPFLGGSSIKSRKLKLDFVIFENQLD